MANIKKAFQPIVSLLEANPKAKVADILDEVIQLTKAKVGGGGGATSFHALKDGTVVALKCSYHKQYFNPSELEFGKKANTVSGFAPMSKDGTAKWNQQFKVAKEQEADILNRVANGDLAVEDIRAEQERIAEERAAIVPAEGVTGYDKLEECLAAQGYTVED